MTLEPYDPEKLDQFALRVFDLASILRRMARRAREERVDGFELNDRKAREWLKRLAVWIPKAESDLTTHINKSRGARLARDISLPDEED